MALPKPLPLFPTYAELTDIQLNEYPQLSLFLKESPEWQFKHWSWAKTYLLYIGRNKLGHTYVRFRNGVEKFLRWSFLIDKIPIDDLRQSRYFAVYRFLCSTTGILDKQDLTG